jgi:hypothetical protein
LIDAYFRHGFRVPPMTGAEDEPASQARRRCAGPA